MKVSSAALFGLLLFGAGCSSGKKQTAAEAKQAEEKEIDRRATVVASAQAQKAVADEEKQRSQQAQRAAEARKEARQALMTSPATFLEVSNLQMVSKGGFRHLASLSLTNKSKFLVTDVRGTVDLHAAHTTTSGDVVASVPIELTGSVAPGASMVFSQEQHTLAGASVQLATPIDQVSFTVTGIRAVGDDDHPAASADRADAGI